LWLQTAIVLLLVVVLAAAVLTFAIMGFVQYRRLERLAGQAHQAGMRFASEDPFDAPRRYAGFALIRSGHSQRANNVAYGRIDGLPVRAFDFRYEVGHGTRRLIRHYGVVVVETETDALPTLLWNERDTGGKPLAATLADGRIGSWRYVGSDRIAETIVAACVHLGDQAVGMEVRGNALMLFKPLPAYGGDYNGGLREGALAAAKALQARKAASPAGGAV
jgi:hypothetical protein